MPVRGWLEAPEHGGSQKPAGFLEIGTVVEGAAQVFEALEGLVLHHLVENIARMERGHGMVATGEVAQVLKLAGTFLRELCFDQPHGLLVVVGEQADQSCFLRVHALEERLKQVANFRQAGEREVWPWRLAEDDQDSSARCRAHFAQS